MKKMNAKDILIPTVSLFVISLVATVLLALVNGFTAPKISALAIESAAESRKVVLPIASEFKEIKSGDSSYFEGTDKNGNTVGYIFTADCDNANKGYGGIVTVMTGIDKDGKVTGIELLTLNETPGLGMNAKKDWFKEQFIGKSDTIGVSKAGASDTEIQALTSATITSKAVASAVNVALAQFAEIGGGK